MRKLNMSQNFKVYNCTSNESANQYGSAICTIITWDEMIDNEKKKKTNRINKIKNQNRTWRDYGVHKYQTTLYLWIVKFISNTLYIISFYFLYYWMNKMIIFNIIVICGKCEKKPTVNHVECSCNWFATFTLYISK